MAKVICTVCGREIDSRGLSGHMKTHIGKEDDTDGIISYPSNKQKIEETDTVVDSGATRAGHSVKQNDLDESQGKRVKKTVKKPAASKPASSPSSKPDPRVQRNSGSKSTGHPKDSSVTETEHKKEWQGLFRD